MTIRRIIQKKLKPAIIVAIVSFVSMPLSAALLSGSPYAWVSLLFALPFAAASFYSAWAVVCPQCHTPFGQLVWNVAMPSLSLTPTNYCTNCGVDLDSPYPEG
jgi:cytochrome c553